MNLTRDELRTSLADTVFGGRLIGNMYRGLIAEAIVHHALGDEWDWCSADWAGWDFQHKRCGLKLEVKQTAATQSWEPSIARPTKARFGISHGKGFWQGATWTAQDGRRAQIYIFAYHANPDRQTADHLNVDQWGFLVLPASVLPATKSTSLGRLREVAAAQQQDVARSEVFGPASTLHASVSNLVARLQANVMLLDSSR